jgi:hypothetical protein
MQHFRSRILGVGRVGGIESHEQRENNKQRPHFHPNSFSIHFNLLLSILEKIHLMVGQGGWDSLAWLKDMEAGGKIARLPYRL